MQVDEPSRDYDRASSRGRSPVRERRRSPQRSRSGGRGRSRERGSFNGIQDSPPASNVLGVFGLSLRTRERDLEDLFSKYGQVEKVVIVYDAYTKTSRGFGFVTLSDEESASRAREALNSTEVDERRIRVDFSKTKKPHDPTPGQYMGRVSERRDRDRRRYRSRSDSRRRPRRRRSHSRRRSRSGSRDYRRRRRSPSFEKKRDSRSRSR